MVHYPKNGNGRPGLTSRGWRRGERRWLRICAGDRFGGSEGDMGREPNKREPREEGTKR